MDWDKLTPLGKIARAINSKSGNDFFLDIDEESIADHLVVMINGKPYILEIRGEGYV